MSQSVLTAYFESKRRYQEKISGLCKPLRDKLGIEHFHHTTITKDHRYHSLDNNPTVVTSYFNNQIYRHDPFVNRSDYSNIPKICMPLFIMNEEKEATEAQFIRWLKETKLNHPLFIKKDTARGYEVSCFYNCGSNQRIVHSYLNNLPALFNFIAYFKEETIALSEEMRDHSLNLSEMIGEAYFNESNIFIDNKIVFDTKNQSFIHEIKIDLTNKLTKREKECITFYIQNQTAKNISSILGISARTVEKHIDNARQKLGCQSKLELFKKIAGL